MYCKKCGAQVHDDAMFCTSCGAKINKEFTSDEKIFSKSNQAYDNHQTAIPKQNNYTTSSPPKKNIGCGTIFSILQGLIILILILWLNTDSGRVAIADFEAYINDGANYIDMVKTSDVELLNTTYGSLITQIYDNCQWSYFKADDGDRIVELNCREKIDGSVVCMQFLLTPIGNNLYYIEPCYMSVNGVTIQDILSWLYNFIV